VRCKEQLPLSEYELLRSAIAESVLLKHQLLILTAVCPSLGNRYFLKVKFDFSRLRAEIATFRRLIVDARDRSRKVIAQRDRQRAEVISLTRTLIRHVEIASEDDIDVFRTSSLEPAALRW